MVVNQLLGVRRSTCNDVCFIESGYPPLQDLVKLKQHKFLHKAWQERSSYNDDPLNFVIHLVKDTNTTLGRAISQFIQDDVTDISVAMHRVCEDIRQSESSRRKTYVEINPTLTVNYVYREKHNINEHHRMAFSQFRVSGHSLACETGRWNRRGRGRLPIQERLCTCGEIQTERHVTEYCPMTEHIRNTYQFNSMEMLFSDMFTPRTMCKITYDILSTYN